MTAISKTIVLVTHSTPMKDDRASDHLARLGYQLDWRTPCEGDKLGQLTSDVAGTVVYGGKYCISDIPSLPFMQDEIRWLEACMEAGIPTLGICQGAQMIAHIMGAPVGPHSDACLEFGYYPLRATPEGRHFLPKTIHMPQAHFHGFSTPENAVRLAESTLYAHQAFSVGDKVFGIQGHPEVTREIFIRWQSMFPGFYNQAGAQTPDEQDRLGDLHDTALDTWFRGFLDQLFGQASA